MILETGYTRTATTTATAPRTLRSLLMLLLLQRDQIDAERELVADLGGGDLGDLDAIIGELELELRGEPQPGGLAPVGLLDQLQGYLAKGHVDGDRLRHAVHLEGALDGPVLVVLLGHLGGLELDRLELAGVEPSGAAKVLVSQVDARPKLIHGDGEADHGGSLRLVKAEDPGDHLRAGGDGLDVGFAQITALSETDVETITTNTKVVAGVLGFDKAKGSAMVRLAVPVDQLRTGIDLRDEHLRSAGWLDAGQFKTIEFQSTKVTKKDDKNWTVEGTFKMHGVTKPVTVDVTLREIPLELIQKAHWGETPGLGFTTKFKLKLSDYGVKIPEVAAAKVSDELTLSIDLVALQKE